MQLSNSGRVVLIDDIFKEALPLMHTFGRNSIPYFYYDGTFERLPDNPPEGIRFVFLDIELQGMEGQDVKTKASGITALLKRIISNSNGPYVIVFWTKHKEIIEQVIENCTKSHIPPVSWLDLEKKECISAEDGSCDIQALSDRLRSKLSEIGAFRLYVEWENILHSASKKFINDFACLVPLGDNWSIGTSALFYKLYKSYVDKNETQKYTEQFKCACLLMNRSFLDTLESVAARDLKLPDGFDMKNGQIDATTLAKLNSSLFLSDSHMLYPATGYVYHEKSETLKTSLKESFFKNDRAPANIELCKIIITPECDLAQNKTLKTKVKNAGERHKIHRIVLGLLYPIDTSPKEEEKNWRDQGRDARFVVGPIWYKDKTQILVLHFSTISFQDESRFNKTPLFSLRRDLLFDLQSKAANHVNRLGNFQLG